MTLSLSIGYGTEDDELIGDWRLKQDAGCHYSLFTIHNSFLVFYKNIVSLQLHLPNGDLLNTKLHLL